MLATPDGPGPRTLIAFDYGKRRIGAAVGQAVTASASALGAAANGPAGPDWVALDAWVRDWQPEQLVVGLPLHADGSPSAMSDEAAQFAAALAERYALPVDTVDERYSSLEAGERLRAQRAAGLRGRVRKAEVDALAAVLIAERWLAGNC